jgi:hypothetical protein
MTTSTPRSAPASEKRPVRSPTHSEQEEILTREMVEGIVAGGQAREASEKKARTATRGEFPE